jgi:transcriptional regulator with XRE-family HTH domain
MNTLGEKIRDLRKKRGLTLDKLAELTESSKSYIWELENKNPPRPSAEKLAKIAEQLGVTLDYLMDETSGITVEESEDKAFYRNYLAKDPETRKKIRKMANLWDDSDK